MTTRVIVLGPGILSLIRDGVTVRNMTCTELRLSISPEVEDPALTTGNTFNQQVVFSTGHVDAIPLADRDRRFVALRLPDIDRRALELIPSRPRATAQWKRERKGRGR